MKIKIFTLKFDHECRGFNDIEIQEFISDKEVISVNEQFFNHENTPYWAVMPIYREAQNNYNSTGQSRYNKKLKRDPRKLLTDEEKTIFDALKKWRSLQAKQDGVPPYIICNNQQLADIAQNKPQMLSQLNNIDGIGEAKTKHYGNNILEIIKSIYCCTQENSVEQAIPLTDANEIEEK